MTKVEFIEKYGIEVLEKNCFFSEFYKDSVEYFYICDEFKLSFQFGLEYRDSIPLQQKISCLDFDDMDVIEYEMNSAGQKRYNELYLKEIELLKEKYNIKG